MNGEPPNENLVEHLRHQHLVEEERLHDAHLKEEDLLKAEHLREEELVERALSKTEVKIFIDDKSFELQPGRYSVTALKKIGNVSDGYQLYEDKKGHMSPLANDAHVEICGGECFEAVPPSGGSS